MTFTPKRGIQRLQERPRVARIVFDSGLARVDRPADMVAFIRKHVYKPDYKKLV